MPNLNSKIWGLHKKKLTVIGARTSHGKSAFALQLAYDLSLQGKKVLFLSLEMDKIDMLERIFCNVMEVDNYQLLTGHFENYMNKWDKFVRDIEGSSLVFSDCLGKNWQEVEEILNNLTIKPDVIILDYLQAIKGLAKAQKEELDDFISNFRRLTITHNFAGVLLSQINRAAQEEKNKLPQLHQLKGSGVIEEHSDIVILLYWVFKTTQKEEDKNKYLLMVEKNRNGRTGFVELQYIPEFYKFIDAQEEKGTVDYINSTLRID